MDRLRSRQTAVTTPPAVRRPATAPPHRSAEPAHHPLVRLQRHVGNQTLRRLLGRRASGEDWVARRRGDEVAAVAPGALRRRLGSGRELGAAERARFEAELGPLGPVRVHAGPAADTVTRRLGAEALQLGRDVALGRAARRPGARTRLLRHELAHVRQAGAVPASGALEVDARGSRAERAAREAEHTPSPHLSAERPALRLRTAALFGQDWEVEHADVASGAAHDQLVAVWQALTGVDAPTAEIQVTPLERFVGNAPLLLRALDFLRDNERLLPPSLLGDVILKSAVFCRGRTDPVASLPDSFYRDMLVAALYTAGAGDLEIVNRTFGTTARVPGLSATATDFRATGSPTSLERRAPRRSGRPITGGFSRPISLTVGFATGARFPRARSAERVIRAARSRIDARLLPAVREVTRDLYVLRALRAFLLRDRGSLVAMDNDSGHYDAASPPTLRVGIAGGPLDTRSTLVHELLHYVFDKSDSVLSEARDSGGADHPAIEALETRFTIIDLIRRGRAPLHESFASSFGRFVKGVRDAFPVMQAAIRDNDRTELFLTVNRPSFVTDVVKSGLQPTASGLRFAGRRADSYPYTPDQFQDLAFIWAQNAVIVRRAMNEAVSLGGRLGVPLADVFARGEWKRAMRDFLRAFVLELQRDPTQGVVALERRL